MMKTKLFHASLVSVTVTTVGFLPAHAEANVPRPVSIGASDSVYQSLDAQLVASSAVELLQPAVTAQSSVNAAQAALYGITTQPTSQKALEWQNLLLPAVPAEASAGWSPVPSLPTEQSLGIQPVRYPISDTVSISTEEPQPQGNQLAAVPTAIAPQSPAMVAQALAVAPRLPGSSPDEVAPMAPVFKRSESADVFAGPDNAEAFFTGDHGAVLGELSEEPDDALQPVSTLAQTIDSSGAARDEAIRQQLYIDVDENILLDRAQPVPTSSFLTPSAYGADWGDAFVSVSGATAGDRSDLDGSMSVGFGLGNAEESVGLEVAVGIISLDGFADDGIVGAKLHKVFPQANNLGVAVGWSNPIQWGAAENEEDTFYGVVTQQFDLRSGHVNPLPLTASLGVGTGTFRSTGAIAAGDNTPNVFGSLGLRVIPKVSVVTSWTGNSLGVAASAALLDVPLVLTAGVSDVTDNTIEGSRFQGSIGYSFSF